ncbi:CNBP [Mytilus coruscus]|uniref:CNBP n=1 Tax=Mytilus coruscus TaxID=42192 RepID=A0A6J8DZP0_MYTCO|nr:CNBP [Mytilus coruscus]
MQLGPTQEIEDFSCQVQEKGQILSKPEHEIMFRFINGLLKKLAFYVRTGHSKTQLEALSFAKVGEAYKYRIHEQCAAVGKGSSFRNAPHSDEISEMKSQISELTSMKKRLTTDKTFQQSDQRQSSCCFNCSCTGHAKRYCNWNGSGTISAEISCQLCNQSGHCAGQCLKFKAKTDNYTRNRVVCQICSKPNHTASECYHNQFAQQGNPNYKITIDFGESEVVQKHANIRCRKRVTLDAHSEIIIWGRLPRNIHFGYQGMCESSTQILSHGLISSKAVVTVSQDRTVPVKILNPGSNSVVIPKDKMIGKFSQLTEEYQVIVNCTDNVPVVQNISLVKQCPTEQGDSINSEFLENFEINPNLKDDQKIALNHLLCDNKEVFVTTDRPNLGCTDIAQHHIILKPDMRPLHQKPYTLTPHKKEVLRHHLDELL